MCVHVPALQDLRYFKSGKTSRGMLQEGWRDTQDPVMCSYKLVTVKFEVWGLQTRVEQFVHKVRGHPRDECNTLQSSELNTSNILMVLSFNCYTYPGLHGISFFISSFKLLVKKKAVDILLFSHY